MTTVRREDPGVEVGTVERRARRTQSGRPIAAGGLRRAVVGLLVGAAAGALALLARDDRR